MHVIVAQLKSFLSQQFAGKKGFNRCKVSFQPW